MKRHFTTEETAQLFETDAWRIRRLFELKILDEPERFGNSRIIDGSMIPAIVDALRGKGWLPDGERDDQSGNDISRPECHFCPETATHLNFECEFGVRDACDRHYAEHAIVDADEAQDRDDIE